MTAGQLRENMMIMEFGYKHNYRKIKLKKMIKNYSTNISASKSIQEIIDFLIDINAQSINQIVNKDKQIESITFSIIHNDQTVFYNLKAKPEGAYQYLISERKRFNKDVEKKLTEQSYKVAWRILRDWVYAQCALIKLEQASPLQVFLSFAYDKKSQTSFYDKVNSNIKLIGE